MIGGMPKTQRYRFIDYFKGLAIILVVFGHIDFANKGIVAWIFGFHMPAFFLASGLLLNGEGPYGWERFRTNIRKRFVSLIVPYVVWALIYAPFGLDTFLRIGYGSHHALVNAGTVTSLWFLPTLFLALVLFETSKHLFRKRFTPIVRIVLAAAALAVAFVLPDIERGYPWNADVSFCAFAFVLLGSVLRPLLDKLRLFTQDRRGVGVALLMGLAAIAFAGTMCFLLNEVQVNTARSTYGTPWVFLIQAVSGSLFLAFVSLLFDAIIPADTNISRSFSWDILSFLGQNSFAIFVVHKPFINAVFKKLLTDSSLPMTLQLLLAGLGVLAISSLLALILGRFAPSLVGKPSLRLRESGSHAA